MVVVDATAAAGAAAAAALARLPQAARSVCAAPAQDGDSQECGDQERASCGSADCGGDAAACRHCARSSRRRAKGRVAERR